MDFLASANEPLAKIARDYLTIEGIQNPSRAAVDATVAAIKKSPMNSRNVDGWHTRAGLCTIHVPEDDAKVRGIIRQRRVLRKKPK